MAYRDNQQDSFRLPPKESPWVVADRKARELFEAYMAQFQQKPHTRQAMAEGWWGDLHDYVKGWAWIQAQAIAGVRHMGWDKIIIEHLLTPEAAAWDAKYIFAKFIRPRITEAKQSGIIEIALPTPALKQWQERAKRRRERKEIKQ